MADAATVSVLIKARDEASEAFRKVETRMGKLREGFEKHRRGIGMAATGIGAAITGIATASVMSSLDQQKGIDQLDQALKNIGTSYEANKKQIEDLASAQQAKTNFGDEEQRKALQKLIQVTGDYDLSMQAMVPMMDMAAATGMKLEGASVLVARAISGEESALKRYGIALETGAGPQAVMNELMAKFAGQAEAGADPLTQLKNRMGDLMQVLGDALLPVIETLIPKIEGAVRKVIEWTEAHPELTKVLALTAAALGAIMLVAGPFLLLLPTLVGAIGILSVAFGVLSAAMAPITLTIIGIGAAVTATILIWNTWGKETNIFIDILKGVLWPITAIIAVIKNWDKIVNTTKDSIRKMAVGIIDWIRGILESTRALSYIIPNIGGFKDKIDSAIGALDDMEGGLHRWANAGSAAMDDMGSDMDAVSGIVQNENAAMAAAFIETGNTVKGQSEVVTKAMQGWGFEVDKATGITEEMAVRMAKSTRDAAEAFQEAGDTVQTVAQQIAESEREKQAAIAEMFDKRMILAEKELEATRQKNISLARLNRERLEDEDGITSELVTLNDERLKLIRHNAYWATVEREKAKEDAIRIALEEKEELHKIRADLERTTLAAADKVAAERGVFTAAAAGPAPSATSRSPAATSALQGRMEQQQRVIDSFQSRIDTAIGNLQEIQRGGKRPGESGREFWLRGKVFDDQFQDLVAARSRAEVVLGKMRNEMAQDRLPESLRKFAGGGISTGGLALVGERGPEIVSLPGGARVHPNGTGPGGVVNNFMFHGAVYGVEELKQVVVEAVRDHAISGGFSGVFAEA